MKRFYKKVIFFLDLLVFYLYESSDFPNIILVTNKKKRYFYRSFIKSIINLFKKKKNLIELKPGSFKTVGKMDFFIKKTFICDNNFLFKKIILIEDFDKFGKSEKIRLKSLVDRNCASVRFVLFLKKSTNLIENAFSTFIYFDFKQKKFLPRYKFKFKFDNFIKILNLYYIKHHLKISNQFFQFVYYIANNKFKKLIQIYKKLSNEFYFLISELVMVYKKLLLYPIKRHIRFLNNFSFLKVSQFIVILLIKFNKK
nr:hypothetical protein CparaKRNrm1_p067 [Cryptomonas paramecium]